MFLGVFLVEKEREVGMQGDQNCWEFKKCGREPGGDNSVALGVCPASNTESFDMLNGGKNGGRICWSIVGTFCGGKVQGSFAKKQRSCIVCDFFQHVRTEEGSSEFQYLRPGQQYKTACV